MQQNEKNFNKQMWVNSLKISLKIILFACVIFFYIISVMFVLAPKFDARIFNFFGMKKAEESCLIQVYEKTESITDLYNVVLLEQQQGHYEKELYYINVLMDREDYDDFCEKLNKSSINEVSKSMYAYVGDIDSYLTNRKVKCLYALNQENKYENRSNSIMKFVRNELKSQNVYDSTFATFVSLVASDKTISREQKVETVETLENMYTEDDEKLTSEYLAARELALVYQTGIETDEIQKIILQKKLVDFLKAEYQYFELLDGEYNLTAIEVKYKQAVETYKNLVK